MQCESDIYDLPIEALYAIANAIEQYHARSRVVSLHDTLSITVSRIKQSIKFTYKQVAVSVRPRAPIMVDGIWSIVGNNGIDNVIAFVSALSLDEDIFLDLGKDCVKMFSVADNYRIDVDIPAVVSTNVEEEEDVEEEAEDIELESPPE